jgi:cyclohexyl-isocyanide hydratase
MGRVLGSTLRERLTRVAAVIAVSHSIASDTSSKQRSQQFGLPRVIYLQVATSLNTSLAFRTCKKEDKLETGIPADTDLPSVKALRASLASQAQAPFKVGILIGPGYIPMDMVGIQTVFGLMPGAEILLVWKNHELVEGFPSWWTKPNATFADCPDLDVLAVPMLPPEIQNDPEVIQFVSDKAKDAKYLIGICNGAVLLGAAGLLKGKRVTASYNALSILEQLGASEVVPAGAGVVVDDNLYTAGPGIGSFEASLMVVEKAFGRPAAQLAELIIEYDPHPPFKTGTPEGAGPHLTSMFEGMMANMVRGYREGAVAHYKTLK